MYWLLAKWRLLAAAALFAVLILLLHSLTTLPSDEGKSETHSSTAESIGEDVTVTGQAIPDKLTATPAKSEVLPADVKSLVDAKAATNKSGKKQDLVRQLALLEIGPYHGKLDKPMRVTVPIKDAIIDKNNTLVVMTRPSDGDDNSWTALTPIDPKTGKARQPKAGDTTVTVEMTHLSILGMFNVSDDVIEAMAYLLESEAFKQADVPKCPNPQKPSANGYSLKRPSNDALLTCLGYDDKLKSYVMHIVSNRRYPLELSWARVSIKEDSKKKLDMVQLGKLLHKDRIRLRHGEEVVATIDPMEIGDIASVSSASSNAAVVSEVFWAVGVSLLEVATKVDTASRAARQSNELIKVALEKTDCYNSLDGDDTNIVTMLRTCFGFDTLKQVFGAGMAIVLGPVILAIGVADTTRSAANAFGDRRNDRDRATITVTRERPSLFPLSGSYRRRGSTQVTFTGAGLGELFMTRGVGGCNEGLQYGNSTIFCNFRGAFSFDSSKSTGSKAVLKEISFEEYKSGSGAGKTVRPPASIVELFPKRGDSFTLSYDAKEDTLLYNTVYLCGPKASPSAWRKC